MSLKEHEVPGKIIEQTEAIDLIASELRWMLEEANKKNIQPDTPEANEMIRMFFSLYSDFKRVREHTYNLQKAIRKVKFTDRALKLVYNASTDLLVKKLGQGIFEQFISVAEHGCLPDGTTYEDL